MPNDAALTTLLQRAVALHQQGRFDAASALYQQVLAADPRQFDALHLSGVIARQQGHPARAVALIEAAIAVAPERANAHCNLGAALQDLGQTAAALASYEQALALDPRYALAHANRGNTLRKLGRLADAVASYDLALALKPGYPEAACHRAIALHDLGRHADALASAELALRGRPAYADALAARGNALQGLGRFAPALADYERALTLTPARPDVLGWRGGALIKLQQVEQALASFEASLALRPDHAATMQLRANALRLLGRTAEAAACYREALALGGNAEQIGFALAALGETAAPSQAPPAYVKALFDQYADHFDAHLVDGLAYRTPTLIGAALARAQLGDALDIVDLGCGTGLCSPLLRPLARRLCGVDLSPNMLAQAARRGLYDALDCADIGDWLQGQPCSLDLIVAADVLVYVGELDGLFARARAAARPNASFCFSVETGGAPAQSWALAASSRYVHSLDYIEASAQSTGWRLVEASPALLREDGGRAVEGLVVLLRAA
ncbi:MAG: tetratricopeptide repeat protein [Massilia sp.]